MAWHYVLLFLLYLILITSLCVCVYVSVAQLCLTLCDPMDYNPPGSSIHGILQIRILEWVAISFSKHLYKVGVNESAYR